MAKPATVREVPAKAEALLESTAHTPRGRVLRFVQVYSIPAPLLEPMNHMATTQRLLVQREKSVTA